MFTLTSRRTAYVCILLVTAIFSVPVRLVEMIKGKFCTAVVAVILWGKPWLIVLDFFLAPGLILFNKETLKIFPFRFESSLPGSHQPVLSLASC